MKTASFISFLAIYAFALSVKADSVTNSVPITTNLTFYLTGQNNWRPQSEFKSDELIDWNVAKASTNTAPFRRFPYNQAFDFKLFDEAGREVSKTDRGRSISLPFHPPMSQSEVLRLHGDITGGGYTLFRPEDMFLITNKGIYELEIRVRLWAQVTNNTPDYEVWTRFLKPPNTNAHYGVVISEPLRVKVIKN